MSVNQTAKTIFFNENTNLYFSNNSQAENDVNLDISFSNKDGQNVSDERIKNHLTLTVSAGTVSNSGKLLDTNLSSNQWKFGYVLRDYSFASAENENEPIVATIDYNDGVYQFSKTFNIVPVVRDVDVLSVNYDEGNSSAFVRYNGDNERNTLDLHDKVSVSSSNDNYTPLATGVIYYIQQNVQTVIKTFPNKTGSNFSAKFNFLSIFS